MPQEQLAETPSPAVETETVPQAPAPASLVTPFSEAAVKAAMPPAKPVDATPADATPEDPASPLRTVVAGPFAQPAPTHLDKVKAAEDAANRIAAKQRARAAARADAEARTRYLEAENARLATEARQAPTPASPEPEDNTPEGRLARLERENAEHRAWRQRREHADAERARASEVQAARDAYVSEALADKETPHLAAHLRFRRAEVVAEAERIAREVALKSKRIPSNKDVREYQEWLYAKAAGAVTPVPAEAPQAATPAEPAQKPVERPKPNGARTLAARTTASATVAKPFNMMNRDEQIAYMAAQLKQQSARR